MKNIEATPLQSQSLLKSGPFRLKNYDGKFYVRDDESQSLLKSGPFRFPMNVEELARFLHVAIPS